MNKIDLKRMDLLEYYDSRQNILDMKENPLCICFRKKLKDTKKKKGKKTLQIY
ncbi:MAG: hypothetical protein CM15mV103_270 [uncultured marine virus]|nr:MAG: hypothetical protein CM15mV103_270 [uncultured marine virus]